MSVGWRGGSRSRPAFKTNGEACARRVRSCDRWYKCESGLMVHRGAGGAGRPSESDVVRFENVGLRYGLGPEILRDLSFRIESHSFQFLTGPSGAGKTSLLRMLFLSLRPTRGLITLFDHDVATLPQDALATLRRRVGIVFQ